MESQSQPETDTMDYWKNQANYYEQKAYDIQQELDEYTENSAQLEKELEASLMQTEKQNRDLENKNQRLKNEIESLRNKLERSQHETNALEDELQTLKKDKEKQAIYIRELEQKNDDLERGQRVVSESVACIESLLNQAYERNAVLESEVDEIEILKINLQRANDEARDLKHELKVIERPHKKEEDSTNEATAVNGHISNAARTLVEIETQTALISPAKREINGNAMTPSSRVSAINIVGDLLRKVGLERFLCRDCGKVKCTCDQPAGALGSTTTHVRTPDEPNTEKITIIDPINDKLHTSDSTTVELRHPKTFTRQLSGPENSDAPKKSVPNRASESPFTRFTQSHGDSGKLRRSFAVRSREGLENLFSFSRKGGDEGKSKQLNV